MNEQRSDVERAKAKRRDDQGPIQRTYAIARGYKPSLVGEVLANATYTASPADYVAEWGCLLWHGATDGRGEGQLRYGAEDFNAPRVMWQSMYGDLDQGEEIVHACGRQTCIEPSHMLLRIGEAFIGAPGGNAG